MQEKLTEKAAVDQGQSFCQCYACTVSEAGAATSIILPVLCLYCIRGRSCHKYYFASVMPVLYQRQELPQVLFCQCYACTVSEAGAATSIILPVLCLYCIRGRSCHKYYFASVMPGLYQRQELPQVLFCQCYACTVSAAGAATSIILPVLCLDCISGRSCHKYYFASVMPGLYQRQELPQVLFCQCYAWTVSAAGAATSIIFVATEVLLWQTHVCRNKIMFVGTKHFFRCNKMYACCDKTFLVTNTCLSQQIFVTTKIFCHSKNTFVVTNNMFCRDKPVFFTTKLLSQQKWYWWQHPGMTVLYYAFFGY